jgi:hypothetical protein
MTQQGIAQVKLSKVVRPVKPIPNPDQILSPAAAAEAVGHEAAAAALEK